MCGIAAIVRLGERPLPGPDVLRRMLAAIAHRGPDGEGTFQDDDVALGAVRLAIVDPRGGRQPAAGCPSSRVTCVYNGELYDAAEVRAALRDRGHALPDACDTSLLPHLYEEHGEAMVERMRGMFAFALWDGGRRTLLLGRDRLGIKPLFWARTPDYLLVASEAKAILATGLVPAAIDRDALDDVFSLQYPCPPRTMFRGVFELRPAHTLLVHARGRVEPPRRWWRAPFPPRGEHRRGSPRALAEALRETLADAVDRHMVADVPVGARLSGGLDSSAVAALARRGGRALTTFSIVFDDPQFDEREHAREVARHLDARGLEALADARMAERLPAMIEALEMPQPMPVAAGGLLLAERERAEGFPVVLTGEGADEILGGYDVFVAARGRRMFESSPWMRPMRGSLYATAERTMGQPAGIGRFLAAGAAHDAAVTRSFHGIRPAWFDVWRMIDLRRDALLGVGGRRPRPVDEAPAGFRDLVRDDLAGMDPLDADLALELDTRLPSWILVIGDRTAMAHGVEMRVPFLDHRVVELVASLPPDAKMARFREKAVLRDAVEDLLPRRIVSRRKQPFMTPVRDWFFAPGAPAWVATELGRDALHDAGLFDPDAVAALRAGLDATPDRSLERIRHELVLMLVLGAQLLHRRFVAATTESPAVLTGAT
ncbi:MAG TPA: asparagine synthase (glutamine-hydrolyzing) [Polyangiaceae bacterium]|jgi:asparagine synthase (glutamine-hydrolysing)